MQSKMGRGRATEPDDDDLSANLHMKGICMIATSCMIVLVRVYMH